MNSPTTLRSGFFLASNFVRFWNTHVLTNGVLYAIKVRPSFIFYLFSQYLYFEDLTYRLYYMRSQPIFQGKSG